MTITKQPLSSTEAGRSASPPLSCISSSPASTLLESGSPSGPGHEFLYADAEPSYRKKFPPSIVISRRQKVKVWREAILRKRELVLELLEVQKVIEDVENEAAQHLARETIARMHQKCYKLDGGNTRDGTFMSTISALKITN